MARPDESPHRVASSDGVEIAAHHFGGEGPPLIICHATGFHALAYRPMLRRLTADFDVWGIDFRGHGASTGPANENFAWSGFAADLLAVIDHIGAPSVRVFGHSMGGASTLLAEKERPGVIEAAFLFEPIVLPAGYTPRNSIMSAAARKRRAEFASKPDALWRYASRLPLGAMRADALAAYVDGGFHDTEHGTVTLACTPEHEAATFDNAGTSLDDLAGLAVRATIAYGMAAEDPSPATFAGPLADVLPHGRALAYDHLGHFGPFQEPDRIADDAAVFVG